MWPFKRQVTNRDTIQRLEDVERQMRRLKEDWTDYLDKISRRDERLRKRQERQETQEGVSELFTPQQQAKARLRARVLGRRGNGDTA